MDVNSIVDIIFAPMERYPILLVIFWVLNIGLFAVFLYNFFLRSNRIENFLLTSFTVYSGYIIFTHFVDALLFAKDEENLEKGNVSPGPDSAESKDTAASEETGKTFSEGDNLSPSMFDNINIGAIFAIGIMIIAACSIAGIVGYIAFKTFQHRKRNRVVRDALEQRIDNAEKRFEKIIASGFTGFVLDPYAILERPLLNDVTVKQTADFYAQWEKVKTLSVNSKIHKTSSNVYKFEEGLDNLALKWRIANQHAILKGIPAIDSVKKRARGLLNLALDDNASIAERRNAYDKLKGIMLDCGVIMHKETVEKIDLAIENHYQLISA